MITTDDLKNKYNDLSKEKRELISLEHDLNDQLKKLTKQLEQFWQTIKDKPYRCYSLSDKEINQKDNLTTYQYNIKNQLIYIKSRQEEINHIYKNLDGIRSGSSVFSPELIMTKIAKLISAFEKKDYRYYEVTRIIMDEDSNTPVETIGHFFSTSKKVVSFYPPGYFEIFKESDTSMISITDAEHYGDIVFYRYYINSSRFIMSDNSTDYIIENEFGRKISGNYIKDFLDKVIDYRLAKMYPSSILDETTTWRQLWENQEGEDITSEEIDVILADFITNYKTEFKEKNKNKKFLVKNNYSLFPKK